MGFGDLTLYSICTGSLIWSSEFKRLLHVLVRVPCMHVLVLRPPQLHQADAILLHNMTVCTLRSLSLCTQNRKFFITVRTAAPPMTEAGRQGDKVTGFP
ncbi:hypothetical protein RRG08_057403 [Elysia crispata]|uniref:Uncharacterized protein n=1 Tax=Elysia crispata TaxID=231223 RepID=A0AAE1B2E9_9GAST|nr:hypothetical protein RRG08_057403 [Elysia crispata]